MKKNIVTENILNKKNSTYLKSLAIIMMLTHHLFGFPEWIKIINPFYELTIFNIPIWLSIGKFCKICVSIFAFISGMGIFISFHTNKTPKRCAQYIFQKILKLIVIYELSYLCFVLPVILLFKSLTICDVIDNFLILNSSIVYTNWYIVFYIEALITILFYFTLPIKRNFFEDIILCFFIPIILNIIFPNNIFGHYFPIFMLGYLFCKYNVFSIFEQKIVTIKMRIIIGLVLLIFAILIRFYFGQYFFKIPTITFITPFLCYLLAYFVDKISCFNVINKTLVFLAKYSTWYWFVHVIFHSNIVFLQKIVYYPKLPVLIILFIFLMLAPVVMLLHKLYLLILQLPNYIVKKKRLH